MVSIGDFHHFVFSNVKVLTEETDWCQGHPRAFTLHVGLFANWTPNVVSVQYHLGAWIMHRIHPNRWNRFFFSAFLAAGRWWRSDWNGKTVEAVATGIFQTSDFPGERTHLIQNIFLVPSSQGGASSASSNFQILKFTTLFTQTRPRSPRSLHLHYHCESLHMEICPVDQTELQRH